MEHDNERVRNITDEMRKHEAGNAADAFYSPEAWRELCDRIDAANEREIDDALNAGAIIEATRRNNFDVVSSETPPATHKPDCDELAKHNAIMRHALKTIKDTIKLQGEWTPSGSVRLEGTPAAIVAKELLAALELPVSCDEVAAHLHELEENPPALRLALRKAAEILGGINAVIK